MNDTRPDMPARTTAEAAAEHRRMRNSTAIFAGATFISRVAGLAREIVVRALFGASTVASAYTIASQIPNLIRSLVADSALNASFVPVFTELKEQGEKERAWRVASTMIGLILLVLGPLTILAMWAAPSIVSLFVAHTFDGYKLTVDLFRIMLPVVVLMALSGVVVGILNAHDHFSTPALAPIAWNVVIIAGLVIATFTVPESDLIYAYAIATLVGTAVQAFLPVPWLRGRGGRLWVALDVRDPAVRRILLLMLPVTASLGLVNLLLLVNSYFATKVPANLLTGVEAGAGPAILDSAFRIYMLPQGIFSVAVSTVVFPALARRAVHADTEGFRETFASGMRQIWILLLPATAFLIVLAEPITRLLYERGEFTPAQTEYVAEALVGYSIGLVASGASLLLFRALFSLQLPWIPTWVSGIGLIANTALVALVYGEWGVTGIAVASSIINITLFVLLYAMLRRKVGRLELRATVRTALLAGAASVVMAGIGWGIWAVIDELVGRSTLGQVLSVGVATLAAGLVYLGIIAKLRLVASISPRAMLGR